MTTYSQNQGFALQILADQDAPLTDRLMWLEKPMPTLLAGQVLVQVLASPVNPSDLIYLKGGYGLAPQQNAYAGFEGCGIVVKANAGWYGRWLVGRRVAMSALPGYDGFWSRYAVTLASYCLPVRHALNNNQAATLIVNPLTSVCLVNRAKQLNSAAIVVNAAASQVGKGVIRYAKRQGIKVIATVRSEQHVAMLRDLGADGVLLTTDPDYPEQLNKLSHQYQAKVLLDAVAADDTAICLHNMPKRSTAIVYGRLTENQDPFGGRFGVGDIIFNDCRVEGFWLANYMRHAKIWQVALLSRQVQQLFADGIFNTDIYGEFGFEDFLPALAHYAQHKSDGKVILVP